MYISVDNAGDQNGIWQVYDVVISNKNGNNYSTLYITQIFEGTFANNLGGPKPLVHITASNFYAKIENVSSIVSWFFDFGPDGYDIVEGMIFHIINSVNHDGTYKVQSVISKGVNQLSEIILDDSTPLPVPGLILGTNIQLIFDAQDIPTGFSVNKVGEVNANSIITNRVTIPAPVNDTDAVNKKYVDGITAKVSQSKMYFMSFLN